MYLATLLQSLCPMSIAYSIEPGSPERDEETARELLRRYLQSINQPNVDKNVEELMSTIGFEGRFSFFVPRLDSSAADRLLISGCAVGSEHIVAKRFGFNEVYGTEVTSEYVQIASSRLRSTPGCFVDFYGGKGLPYANDFFSCVYSGHVIEHTPDPFYYFMEHFRVLRPGGYFFLEFPNRYHWKELHTGVVSIEWLPKPLRAQLCKYLGGSRSPFSDRTRLAYRDILATLQPISVWQLKSYLKRLRARSSKVVAIERPVPGFVRVLLQK